MRRHFAEIVVREILPSVRAQIAQRLIERGFSQQLTAKKLCVTQAAVSQYIRQVRGHNTKYFDHDQIREKISLLADIVAQVGFHSDQALKTLSEICSLIKQNYFKQHENIYPGLELCEDHG